MCKCIGCGVLLQNEDSNALGYTRNILNKFCERCFRINNYNDYKFVVKDNADFINILTDINKTNDLVVLVVDLFNINKNIEDINKYIKPEQICEKNEIGEFNIEYIIEENIKNKYKIN